MGCDMRTTIKAAGFFSLVYNSLVTLDNSGHAVPSLATAWTQKSPTTYVFTLRPPGAPRV